MRKCSRLPLLYDMHASINQHHQLMAMPDFTGAPYAPDTPELFGVGLSIAKVFARRNEAVAR